MGRFSKRSYSECLIVSGFVALMEMFLIGMSNASAYPAQDLIARNQLFVIFWGTAGYMAVATVIRTRRVPTCGDRLFFIFGIAIPYLAVVIYTILEEWCPLKGLLN